MSFVANFIRFQQCKHFKILLRFDKVTDSLKVETFLRHSVVLVPCVYVCVCDVSKMIFMVALCNRADHYIFAL